MSYPTTRTISDMPDRALQDHAYRYGEHLPALVAERNTNRAIRAAIDREEHCCDEYRE